MAASIGPCGGGSDALAADGFCYDLKAVLHEAGSGFVSFQGPAVQHVPDDGGGDGGIRYAALRHLSGAEDCGIDRVHSDGDDVLTTYLCWFRPDPTREAAMSRIATDVARCIGAAPSDRINANGGHATATADFQRATFVISLSATVARPVVLEVSGK